MPTAGLVATMDGSETQVVAAIREGSAVLVCGGPPAGWRLPSRTVETDSVETALAALLDALELTSPSIRRRASAIEADGRIVLVLVDVDTREVAASASCPGPTWQPPAVLREPSTDRWWRAYSAVAPTVETVAADTERGSTAIAIDALWALRDVATTGSRETVAGTAEALLEARPSMAALANRVNRVMSHAHSTADVEAAATAGIDRAAAADTRAAKLAAETLAGQRVLTLSRSGTVRQGLASASTVVVLASIPGGEGRAVASELGAAGLEAEWVVDADVYDRCRSGDIDAVLVGADTVTPDGGVVNKVGTRAAALAARSGGVPCYCCCGADKVRATAENDDEPTPLEPMFDWTPPALIEAVLTDRGRLDPAAVRAIADEHRQLTSWRDRWMEKR